MNFVSCAEASRVSCIEQADPKRLEWLMEAWASEVVVDQAQALDPRGQSFQRPSNFLEDQQLGELGEVAPASLF